MGIQEQKYALFTQVFHIPSALCNGTFVLLLKPYTSLPIDTLYTYCTFI